MPEPLALNESVTSVDSLSTSSAAGTQRISWLLAGLFLCGLFLWLDRGLLTGATAPNWDAWSFYAPQFTLVADNARAGRFLRWDPWEQGGSPDQADPQVGAASPVMISIGALTGGTGKGFRIYWLIIWLAGPVGMLLLARHLEAPPWVAVVVALAYAFCGFYTGHAEHTTFIYSFSFIPWIFWRFDAGLCSMRFWPAAQAGVLWGLSALGGYPSLTVITGGFLMLWTAGRGCTPADDQSVQLASAPWRKRLLLGLAMLATVFCVGAAVLSPTYVAFFTEAAGYSERAGGLSRALAVSGGQMPPGALLNFASPYLILLKYPGLRNTRLWPDADLSLMAFYMGALPVILSVFALVQRPKSGWRWWIAGMTAFAVACALGNHLPVRGWLYDYCPPTRFFRHVGAFRAYAIFGVMILALFAGRDLRAAIRKNGNATWLKLFCAAVLIAAVAIAAFFYEVKHPTQLPAGVVDAKQHVIAIWLACTLLAFVMVVASRARVWLPVLLLIIAVGDACATRSLSDPLISGGTHSGNIWVRLDREHRSSLVMTNGLNREFSPPQWTGNPGHNNNLPLKIPTFYNVPAMRNRFHIDFAHHPIILAMGLGADRIWFSKNAAIVPPSDVAYSGFIKRSETLGAPILVVHPRTEMREISHSGFDISSNKPVTQADIGELDAIAQSSPATRIPARVLRYTPDHLDLAVDCPSDGWILVTDRWASGWKATVNGQSEEVDGGDFVFRAVRVRAGKNIVQLYYQQRLYFVLLGLSWLTLAGVLLVQPIVSARRPKI